MNVLRCIKRGAVVRRRGSMLIDMMGVIISGSALLFLAVGMIHQSFFLSKRTQGRAELQATLGRLASVWRSDAHRSKQLEIVSETEVHWVDSLGDKVTYRWVGATVTRESSVRSSQGVAMNQKELFPLGDGYIARFEESEKPKRGRLIVLDKLQVHDAIDGDWIPVRLKVESVVGGSNRVGEASR